MAVTPEEKGHTFNTVAKQAGTNVFREHAQSHCLIFSLKALPTGDTFI